MKVFPDEKNVVRTVLVGCRPRHKADRHKDYVPKILEEITVPVQRISVLLAVEERHLLPPASDDLHVCEEELRVASLRPDHQEGAQDSEVAAAPPHQGVRPRGERDTGDRGCPADQRLHHDPGLHLHLLQLNLQGHRVEAQTGERIQLQPEGGCEEGSVSELLVSPPPPQ